MKKILKILILSLLLSVNANSADDIDIALENCADDQFLGDEEGIPKSILESQVSYNQLLKDKELLRKNLATYTILYKTKYNKFWKDNPRPKFPKQKTSNMYNFEDYKIVKDKWDMEEEQYMKPYTDQIKVMRESYNEQRELIYEMKKSLTLKYLKKINVKDKATTVPLYTIKFTECEVIYYETPKGFKLKWENN